MVVSPMIELRRRILLGTPADYGVAGPAGVWAVAMDMGMKPATATVVALIDGNASLYTTGTFGVMGGVGHAQVRAAAMALCVLANSFVDATVPTGDTGYPGPGRIRFYLKTPDSLRMVEEDQAALGAGDHRLSPLFLAAHDVLSTLRLATEAGGAEQPLS